MKNRDPNLRVVYRCIRAKIWCCVQRTYHHNGVNQRLPKHECWGIFFCSVHATSAWLAFSRTKYKDTIQCYKVQISTLSHHRTWLIRWITGHMHGKSDRLTTHVISPRSYIGFPQSFLFLRLSAAFKGERRRKCNGYFSRRCIGGRKMKCKFVWRTRRRTCNRLKAT